MKLTALFALVALVFGAHTKAHAGSNVCKVYVGPTCMSASLKKLGYRPNVYTATTNSSYNRSLAACIAAVKDLLPYCPGRDNYAQIWTLFEVNGKGTSGGAAFGYDDSTYQWLQLPNGSYVYKAF